MKELVCRNCGAHNPAQSKFCNKCGASVVSETSQICPNCEVPNPIHLLYCDNCGTRLSDDALPDDAEDNDRDELSEGRSQRFSLPSRPPGQTGNLDVSGEIPEWLRTGEVKDEEGSDDEIPDWWHAAQEADAWEDHDAPTLEELSGDHAPKDDLPTWLLEDETADEIFHSEKNTEELFRHSESEEPQKDGAPSGGSTNKEELSAWLQDLDDGDADTSVSDVGDELFPTAEGDAGDLDIPEWLADGIEAEEEVEDDTVEEAEAMAELDRWLTTMEENDSASDDEPDEEDAEGIPDWLSDLDDETDSAEIEETPEGNGFSDWLVDAEKTDQEQAPEVQSLDDQDFEQWLSGAQEDEDTAEEPFVPLDANVPDWLDEDDDEGSDALLGQEIPDWLTEEDSYPVEEHEDSSLAEEADAPAPEWLSEIVEDDFKDESELFSFLEEDDDSDLALAEPASEQHAEAEFALEDETDEEFEGWLEAREADEAPQLSDKKEGSEADFLDWLATLEDEEEGEPDEALPLAIEDQVEDEVDVAPEPDVEVESSEALPAWLSDLEDIDDGELETLQAASDEEMPEWLQNLTPEGTGPLPYLEKEAEQSDESPANLDEGTAEEAELPEWLTGVSDELESDGSDVEEFLDEETATGFAEQTDSQEWFAEGEPVADFDDSFGSDDDFEFLDEGIAQTSGEAIVPADDLPDWFSDVMANIETEEGFETPLLDEPSAELPNVPEQLAGNELPNWLGSSFADADVQPAERTPLEEIPDWLRPPVAPDAPLAMEEEDALILGDAESSGEWTDLLDALPPPEQETDGISEAEIPAWLQALKPKALRDDDESEPIQPEETEGPLMGLRGVIGIAPVVTKPRSAERTELTTLSKEQEQQVALLRQLARSEVEETDEAKETKRKVSAGPWVRLLLGILLIAAILSGLLVPNLLPAMTPVTNSGFEKAASAIDNAANRPVLVAFDYTPALAGALSTPSKTVLQRLADNNSSVLLVSQSAAGATLAKQTAATVPELKSQNLGYIPGEAIGLRRLAGCLDSGAACDRPFGPPLTSETQDALGEVALVIVISGDRDSLVDWIEQVDAPSNLPMLAVVTPAMVPVVAPYDSSGQVISFSETTGLADAESTLAARETAVTLARWLVAAIMILGALYYLVVGTKNNRRKTVKHE